MTSGSDPARLETTGMPQAIASTAGRPKPSISEGCTRAWARLDGSEDRVGCLADDAEPVFSQAEPVAKLAARGLGHRDDPVRPSCRGMFLEQPGQPSLPSGEDELGMGQCQRVVHSDDQPG